MVPFRDWERVQDHKSRHTSQGYKETVFEYQGGVEFGREECEARVEMRGCEWRRINGSS